MDIYSFVWLKAFLREECWPGELLRFCQILHESTTRAQIKWKIMCVRSECSTWSSNMWLVAYREKVNKSINLDMRVFLQLRFDFQVHFLYYQIRPKICDYSSLFLYYNNFQFYDVNSVAGEFTIRCHTFFYPCNKFLTWFTAPFHTKLTNQYLLLSSFFVLYSFRFP